jgi:hypothetical protein
METMIITVLAGEVIGRFELGVIENEVFESKQSLLNRLGSEAKELYKEGVLQIWKMTDFMEAWNSTDDDGEYLEIDSTFLGYVKIKNSRL